jgi:hypothetical protein
MGYVKTNVSRELVASIFREQEIYVSEEKFACYVTCKRRVCHVYLLLHRNGDLWE